MIESIGDFLTINLTELSRYVIDPNKRIFGLYLLSACVLALPVYLFQQRRAAANQAKSTLSGFPGFLKFLFPKAIYTAKSAQHDYQLFIVNKFVKAALVTPFVFTMVPIAMTTSDVLASLFGNIQPLSLSHGAIMWLFTLILFVLDDFTRFLLHWLLHKVPVLWDFHKVHHSATVLTPFTIYRSHPVENFLYACRMALAQGLSVGMGYYLFGPNLQMMDVLGANIFVFIFNVMGSNLRHSHIWLSWGGVVENWFISPAQHQIHHSTHPAHFDHNLGSALAIWDRLFGTLIKAQGIAGVEIGIGNAADDPKHNNLWQIYIQPFVQASHRLRSHKPLNTSKSHDMPNTRSEK